MAPRVPFPNQGNPRLRAAWNRLCLLAQVAFAAIGKLKVTVADAAEDYLAAKTSAGTGIDLEVVNPGLNEVLRISNVGIDGEQVLYVGKHGDNANTGASPEQAFLTFTAALAAASAAAPTSVNRYVVVCVDAGIYSEDLAVPSWVDVFAPNATVQGEFVMEGDTNVQVNEVQVGAGQIAFSKPFAGTGTSRVKARSVVATGSGIACLNLAAGGVLIYETQTTFVENGFAVGDISSAAGHMHVECEDIYLTGTGTAVARANAGTIVGRIHHVLEQGAGIGNGTGVNVFSGEIELSIGELLTNVAYSVGATGTLRLFVNQLSGARNVVAGGLASVTFSGFSKQQATAVAADANTNLGTFQRLGAAIFNADNYPAGATFTLRAACQVDSGQTYEVRLYDVTAGAYLAGTITDTNASLEVKTLALSLGAGERIYELHARLASGAGGSDFVSVPSAFIDVAP